MKKLCVFGGSSPGHNPLFVQQAWRLGELCAEAGWGIVYGGGGRGIMGAVADGCMSKGGLVEGVIPQDMVAREWGHQGVRLHVVQTMHERKQMMHDLCDALVALPGGIGTLDEICEALAWQKLEIHQKPVALLNTASFYDGFVQLLECTVENGFYHPRDRSRLWIIETPEQLLARLSS